MNDHDHSPAQPFVKPDTAVSGATGVLSGRRRWLAVAAAVLGLALIAWLLTPSAAQRPVRQGRSGGGGPMPVAVTRVVTGDMPIMIAGLGTVTPLATVTVQSQISGQIVAIRFKEGGMVRRGDPLIEIDPRPYQVALEQAQGALARDVALLNNAQLDLGRYQTLFQQDSIAEQQLATQRATVLQYEGTVKTDQAAIDAARLNLTYCHIVSPVDGLAGLQQVNLGNYVTPATANGLLVVTQLQPITVVFPLPEDQIPPILQELHAGHALPVTAYDRSHRTLLATGTMSTVDSQIDTATGTLRLKARFPNDDLKLFPNQFVNVDLLLTTLHGAPLIPQSAIQRGAPGTFVYVVGEDSTVGVRTITLGPGDAMNVSVSSGLAPGEEVVVDGADRLKDGARVLLRQAGGGDSRVGAAAAGAAQGPRHHRSHSDQGRSTPSPSS